MGAGIVRHVTSIGDELGDMPVAATIWQLGLPVVEGGSTAVEVASELAKEIQTTSSGEVEAVFPKLAANKPFILSEGLPPVPHKLTVRILKGEYVDMAELLRDNLEVERRASSTKQPAGSTATVQNKPRREIPDLLSWVQCFGTYMAIITSQFPNRTKELLAYQTLIVREARRCGGRGWLAYDSYFRQQVVGDDSADWSRLNQSLYAVTFITQGDRERAKSCVRCLESDHMEEQCALYSPPVKAMGSVKRGVVERSISDLREAPSTSRGRGFSRLACFAWNQGDCRFPACKYRHICVRCSGDHRISRCPWLRSDRDAKFREMKGESASDKR